MKKNTYIILLVAAVIFGGLILLLRKQPTQKTSFPTPSQNVSENVKMITVTKDGFLPSEIRVSKGTRIIWTNNSGQTVTVNSDNHPTHTLYPILNLGSFENGASVQVVIEKIGTYTYHNHFNPSQRGTIIVE